MALLTQNFDGQADGTAITPSNSGASGTAFTSVTIPGTLGLTYSQTQRAHGDRSMEVSGTDTTGQFGYVAWTAASLMAYSFRGYFYFTGLPNALVPIVQSVYGAGTTKNLVALTSAGALSFADMNGTQYTTTWTASLNTWYRVEATVNVSATGSVNFKVYSLDSTSPLASLNPTSINMGTVALSGLRVGKNATAALVAPYYIDDLALSDSTTAIGPYVATGPTVIAASNVAGTAVTLSATATTFDNATPTYAWVQTAGPTVTLSSTTTASPTFTAPSQATYSFTVTVTDSNGATASDSTDAVVGAVTGQPTATAAMFHDVFVINATGSAAAAGGALSYSIAPLTGLTQLQPGIWVGNSPSVATPYTITVTEAGNVNTATTVVTVPGSGSGGTGIHILMATADQSGGGSFV